MGKKNKAPKEETKEEFPAAPPPKKSFGLGFVGLLVLVAAVALGVFVTSETGERWLLKLQNQDFNTETFLKKTEATAPEEEKKAAAPPPPAPPAPEKTEEDVVVVSEEEEETVETFHR